MLTPGYFKYLQESSGRLHVSLINPPENVIALAMKYPPLTSFLSRKEEKT